MAGVPVTLTPVMNLADMGVNPNGFRFGLLTMESDRFICVKDQAQDGSSQVAVIDMHANNSINRKPMKAEASLMNPKDNIIALKGKTEGQAGHFIQVFNLDTKEKLGVHQFGESIVFWKWITDRALALVSDKSIYHWTLEANSTPAKIFDRSGKLAESNTQIINYAVDSQQKWCLLTGISTQDQGKTIDGHMVLYSVEKKQQQVLEGHAGNFAMMKLEDGQADRQLFAFVERKEGQTQTRLHIMDIYKQKLDGHAAPFKVTSEVTYPPEAPNDFAVSMHMSDKYGVLFLITKAGYIFMFDIYSGAMLFRNRISNDTIFISAYNATNGGVLVVNRKGDVLTATVNADTLVNYIQTNLRHLPNATHIAFGLAKKFKIPGADELFVQQFNQAFARGEYKEAAKVAAQCASGALRTPQIIQQFKSVQAPPGQSSPILQYFSALLEMGKLNAMESIELVRPVVAQNRREFIERWLREDKLECTEELGDIVAPLDGKLALSIYLRANASAKVIKCFTEQGQYEQIVAYAKKVNYQADYSFILRNMLMVNPEGAVTFAKQLLDNDPPLIDINSVVEVMLSQNRLQEFTSILLDHLKNNKPEEGYLQTKLLEMNLLHAPQVAETIFQMDLFTHYDRQTIAQLCEKAGLYQRALEHYTDVQDIKRVMLNTHGLNPEWLTTFFGRMPPEVCLESLYELLRHNRQNLQVVVQCAIKYQEQIGALKLVELFESFGSWEGIFYFLGAILAFNNDADVHFKYIEACAKLNHMQEVERVCRESNAYDPVRVKEFLKQAKLPDPRPLIYVCDLHNFVGELAEYLYKNSLMKYIEVYVVKVNPQQAPTVIGTLIDLDCSEDFIKGLLQNVRGACPVSPLVEEVEKRNRLRLLLPWLEARMAEGNQEPDLHNALAKIYIDTNKEPETFLKTNAFYDSKVVGKYCEDRDPHLAYTAYKRAWGSCDEELVEVTNKNGLFRLQARYLVERQSQDLWGYVLKVDNEFRRNVIDQVVATALPESSNPDEVSATVKAFISADLPQELIELLEKIVLHNSDFSGNRNLQNLLILTAIKADKKRVMDYINRLNNYDGPEIAKIALGEQYQLYEEAFTIYKKFNLNSDAVDTLLMNLESLDRAGEFAARANEPEVWSKLGKAQLVQNLVSQAIDSYLKAQEAGDYKDVIQAAEREETYEDLVKYLQMARQKTKDQIIDSELVYAFAKCDNLGEMEEFISGTNTANVQAVGDRLFDEGHFKAAKILFQSIPNNAKLASCHVHLGEFSQAVEAARKANNPKTWKEVNFACVAAKEFRCAQIAGMNIIVHPDHLEELILHYEKGGYFEELIQLLDSGIGGERAHVGLYTELGILYAKYKPEKLMDFCKLNASRMNIPKIIRGCERHCLWPEAVFLYTAYDEYDAAANTMILHSPSAWTHDQFVSVMQKVSNSELFYRAISFYLEMYPLLLNGLLTAVANKVDHARVVQQIRKLGHLPLIIPYMKQVQQHNIKEVNDALNDLYVDGEDHESLRQSIEEYDNFDQLALAQRVEKHDLLEMRRIACLLYRKNKRFKQSIELSKIDRLYQDAMETARDSGNQELAESLLKYFVEIQDRDCFASCLYVCYDLIRPDIALELAWRNRFMDQVMPYMIQIVREYTYRVDALDKKIEHKEEEEQKEKSAPNDYVPDFMPMNPMLQGMGQLALMAPPGMMSNPNPLSGGMTNPGGFGTMQPGMPPSMPNMPAAAANPGMAMGTTGGMGMQPQFQTMPGGRPF
mmetsp:Transcript_39448/g.98764  ORF Transcript_39448/g.98764 Transcript_39448/m.98764 type:complete len:1743 (+) Transcript_39448:183-5411(+)